MAEESDRPTRSYLDDPNTAWLHGKPDYSLVNSKYLKERTSRHKEGSLEKLVENTVKTWEAESTHKAHVKDWQSVELDKFTISINGGRKYSPDEVFSLGSYNLFLGTCPLYDASQESSESSSALFNSAFSEGFAWELLKLYSGPPVLAFTWRHWGTWSGKYKDVEPTGETIEVFGSGVVRVSERDKVETVELFFDPGPMMAKLTGFKKRA